MFVTTTTSATTPTKVQQQQQEEGEGKSAGRQATNLYARRHQSMSIGPGAGIGPASGSSERDGNRVQSIMVSTISGHRILPATFSRQLAS